MDGTLDIILFYKDEENIRIRNVDPALGVYAWTVGLSTSELPDDNSAQYYFKIMDNDNQIAPCDGRSSGVFLITN